ncbi:UDP-N-acetylmuramoylalanine--D-glutamate ligase [Candidatus Kaiserbacteria bacterium RIFCSPHIGHO2_01_FULL_56_24]|uniref:UDP-N-acetylmuramoylalanine--D-glutamate ligase n=1 Tax=Candidatus Kaiserbacteria bacterium RIFCSPHIGHO2_01_FULL_56_24 TaxID=1798487 RepID=A0A1F6DCU5_9BACT|nr:MAG: UDP-N-acetylmuramoylalanine--D-glutamate ligase [Candidatus Kaiserbacteria bacterium RIFCSPHIGHO2_01_FULL_56_24]
MGANSYFRNKKVTVMGLGLLGGVGDIKFLAESGADIIATDLKGEAELAPSLVVLKDFSNIRYTLGRHELADFRGRDLVIKAPGTPLDSPYVAEAHKHGTPVTMWAALFARFAGEMGALVVGITGTRGKTTVTAMVSVVLRTAGKKVIEGGNVQGTSLLPHLPELTRDTTVVLELDSWKLQGFGEAKISPNIGLFTTFYADHLNYYKGDPSAPLRTGMDAYLADKANIFLNQTEKDTLILGTQVEAIIKEKYGDQIKGKLLVASGLSSEWHLQIPGEHNRYNAALALAVARELHISDEISKKALEAFKGVPGRLEFLREVRGVKIYNDTTSTTPESTIAALEALGPAQTIVIAGGTDKNLPLEGLAGKLKEAKGVVLLAGSGTARVVSSLQEAGGSRIYGPYEVLAPAVTKALELVEPGDTILFSPAFTSFEMFKNEYDRGEQFNAVVQKL